MTYGYVGFSFSKDKWYDRVIAKITKSRWSHSFFTVPAILDQEMVMESVGGGVMMTPFKSAYKDNATQAYELYKFNTTNMQIDAGVLSMLNQLETSYGYLEYPWFIWRTVCGYFGKDIRQEDNWSKQGIVCSGLVRCFIEQSGYSELFKQFGKNSATAEDVYQIIKNNPKLFELIERKD